ncbi:ribosome biogenesis regulatory protein-domain-containing protein [Schizothecium vesticola]|uniref:Ribosome biogenesis regulatory protein n=1 Tax=Schizothecium vesticola TaxID=314040 RepID=A0AA40K4Y7_9PEZI|nr:ribosome biogenesis regulatory protein-domain-containing protein [Schizothecium vesticola]
MSTLAAPSATAATTTTVTPSATTTKSKTPKLPVTVDKPTPYYFDLGLLLANDPNPLSLPSNTANREAALAAVARDGTQVLINQLLTTCPISSTSAGVLLSLPPIQTPLPREKPVPAPKAETKWSAFAKRRGIAPKTREQRRNLALDEVTGEYGRKWGYQGANKAGQDEPIVEVAFNSKKELERKEGTTIRGDKRREIREKVKRNERKMRNNQRKSDGRK